MEAETITLRDGDVYRWSYREPGDDRTYGRYHCCSRIAVVYRGRLRDTFWQIGTSFDNGRSFDESDLAKLELTFLANMDDLVKANEYEAVYYDDADIVDLNHSNSSRDNFYLRKGAARSQKKMLESAKYKLEQYLSEERMARNRAEVIRASIAKIEAGDLAVYL